MISATPSSSRRIVVANAAASGRRQIKPKKNTRAHSAAGGSTTPPMSRSNGRIVLFLLVAMTLTVVIDIFMIDYILGNQEAATFLLGSNTGGSSDDLKQSTEGIRPLKEILRKAGVEVTERVLQNLPPLEEVEALYGPKPIILGLERCEEFRQKVKQEDAYIAPAGMFNTGTNLMSEMLQRNCYLPEKIKKRGRFSTGMRFQVAWGKHTPVSWRGKNVAKTAGIGVVQTNILPALVIKDPYTWMSSMCRHWYAANWHHSEGRCSNLVPITPYEIKVANGSPTVSVDVYYSKHNVTHHKSLADLWNDWYEDWIDANFPKVIVRFEDLLFHAEQVITEVCHCGGGTMREGFQYIADSAKTGGQHEGSSGMIDAMISYSNATKRMLPFHAPDKEYAKANLRSDIMNMFHYVDPPS